MSVDVYTSLSVLFVGIYNKRKEDGKNYIPCTSVARKVMVKLYNKFVIEKLIEPIENISEPERELLVEECKLSGIDFLNLGAATKILYVIKQINSYT